MDLDDVGALQANDPHHLGNRIAELPAQCLRGWEIASGADLPSDFGDATAVAILGMGGSAIGGDLVGAVVADGIRVPVTIIRDYQLPGSVGSQTLVIASSHSGDTEETLSAFEEALSRGAKLVAVTTGGRLAEMARRDEVPLLTFEHPGPPRAAIGFSISLVLGILSRTGLVPDAELDLKAAVALLEEARAGFREASPTEGNRAKQMAGRLFGRIPITYGAEHLAPVARRWKSQFNEVAKNAAYFELLPELDHNAIEGTNFPPRLDASLAVVALASPSYHERTARRVRLTAEILTSKGLAVETVDAEGESRLGEALWSVFLGDYTSLYLAALNHIDPHTTETLDLLKQQMAGS